MGNPVSSRGYAFGEDPEVEYDDFEDPDLDAVLALMDLNTPADRLRLFNEPTSATVKRITKRLLE
jgi:hypothetical protein